MGTGVEFFCSSKPCICAIAVITTKCILSTRLTVVIRKYTRLHVRQMIHHVHLVFRDFSDTESSYGLPGNTKLCGGSSNKISQSWVMISLVPSRQ